MTSELAASWPEQVTQGGAVRAGAVQAGEAAQLNNERHSFFGLIYFIRKLVTETQ